MTKILFFIIFIAVFALMNLYTYRRFLTKLSFLEGYERIIRYVLYLMSIMIILFLSARRYDIYNQQLLLMFSYAIGVLFMLFVAAVIYDLFHISFAKVPFDKQRRKFMKVAFDVTFLIMTFSYVLKGIINGIKDPILRRVNVQIKGCTLDTLKVVQLSDVHVGNTIKKPFVEKLVQRVNALSADLIVITGDLVDAELDRIKEDLSPLKDLHSTYGTYFILGNHEMFHDPYAAMAYIKTLDITVLENEAVVIDDRVNLVGLTDHFGSRVGVLAPDLPKAFSKVNNTLPTIVLAHQPKMIKELETYRPDLVLSGHTHGGQIFPFGLLVLLDQPYLSGLYQHNAYTQIYVSSGTGFWGPAIRVLADSEIAEINVKGV